MSIIPRFFMEATVVLGRLPISNPRWCATGFVVGRYEGTQDGNEKFRSVYKELHADHEMGAADNK